MEMFVVQGGTPVRGHVTVSGSKNASLPIMAAALMAQGTTLLRNVPDLVDVRTLTALLSTLGTDVTRGTDGTLQVETHDHRPCTAEYDLVRRMRASVCVLGPLLARRGRACVSLPGGCNIGTRPIDLHLKGLAALGAEIDVRHGYVVATADRLRGARVSLAGPWGSTVTGTCNVLAAAVLAHGTTVIDDAAREPEVVALGEFLNRMGANIAGLGTSQLVIDGVDQLQGTDFTIIPDRIEAATLLIAAAITGGSVSLERSGLNHLTAVVQTLQEMGVSFDGLDSVGEMSTCSRCPTEADAEHLVTVSAAGPLRPLEITAVPYPGIPTDLQAQLMALLSILPGESFVRDTVFPDRFMHVAELCRMGARIRQQGSLARIRGVDRLTGAHVMASDLRASAALVLAGLAAEGETVIHRVYHLDRGYERMEFKLRSLGADVRRLRDDSRLRGIPAWADRELDPQRKRSA